MLHLFYLGNHKCVGNYTFCFVKTLPFLLKVYLPGEKGLADEQKLRGLALIKSAIALCVRLCVCVCLDVHVQYKVSNSNLTPGLFVLK